jgi:hypothetical protein
METEGTVETLSLLRRSGCCNESSSESSMLSEATYIAVILSLRPSSGYRGARSRWRWLLSWDDVGSGSFARKSKLILKRPF